ncbi:hypothetical protein EDEG_03260 [Edhazardia aedis USNM 41457]|uniref:Transmembrane protein n=1 Tax=Edhazardia aedis (strain USNM 41457) TaxID=1003232 RepID=J9D382_EDHAE|nr:hypothetical protein EDEG_03260 [Edhazardia aedis USNM 41457]|eukprot:EJW02296.1 hypothetical protein EDEG_03260 [Edhazardia aedis USNM 41457]
MKLYLQMMIQKNFFLKNIFYLNQYCLKFYLIIFIIINLCFYTVNFVIISRCFLLNILPNFVIFSKLKNESDSLKYLYQTKYLMFDQYNAGKKAENICENL